MTKTFNYLLFKNKKSDKKQFFVLKKEKRKKIKLVLKCP